MVASYPTFNLDPALGPALWEDFGKQSGEAEQIGPDWYLAAQTAHTIDAHQCVKW